MLFDMNDFLKLVKKTALEAVNASRPTNVVFGKVINDSPLKIKIDQKLVLSSAQLVLCENVTNFLNVGEEVVLIQMSGGQKYVVIDKIGKG